MQVQVDIEFDQLLKIVKTLPAGQLKLLKAEIDRKRKVKKSKTDLETFLLTGPVATQKQLSVIKNNRKAINQWRTN
ncbi:MAG: hypothetical protein K2Q24_10330 [Chitinophagaceae bacterium]|nr:hypothetical protein [Chitinophagaceae bacterium]